MTSGVLKKLIYNFDGITVFASRALNVTYHYQTLRKLTNETDLSILSNSREEVTNSTQQFMNQIYPGISGDEVAKGFDYRYQKQNQTWFTYQGNVDVVGHAFSARRIEAQYTYGEQLANVRAIYNHYIAKEGENVLLVFMSDHGIYEFPYEVELTTHGYQDHENRAFAFFMSPRFKGRKLSKGESMHISRFAGSLCLFMKHCNIPILQTHSPLSRFKGDLLEDLVSLRAREVQLTKYLEGVYDKAVGKDTSPFVEKLDVGKSMGEIFVQKIFIEEYSEFVRNLEAKLPYHEFINELPYLFVLFVISSPLLAYFVLYVRGLFRKDLF